MAWGCCRYVVGCVGPGWSLEFKRQQHTKVVARFGGDTEYRAWARCRGGEGARRRESDRFDVQVLSEWKSWMWH